MNNHTKGKWNAMPQPDNHGLESNYWAVTNGDTVIHVSGEDIPENESNAQLIAAAPDLLEALKLVERTLLKQFPQSSCAADVKMAIKKATS